MNSVLSSLLAVARRHGLNPSAQRIVEQYGKEPIFDDLVKISREIGLSASIKLIAQKELLELGKVFPILAELQNGNALIIPGLKVDPEGVTVVATLSAQKTNITYLALDEFFEVWSGRVVLFKKLEENSTKSTKKFGLMWFLPQIQGREKHLEILPSPHLP